jgi:hypothetical protein
MKSPRARALGATVALATGAILVASVATLSSVSAAGSTDSTVMPTDRAMEASTGIRVLSAHVVADGGVVDLRYQVLDPLKVAIVEGDVTKTPQLTDVDSGVALQKTASMRRGHVMRSAGTYFLLYYNRGMAVRPGDKIDVTIDGITLHNVPVS